MKKMFLLVSIMGLLFMYSQNIQVHAKNYNDNTDWVQAEIVIPEETQNVSRAVNFPCYGDVTGNGVNLRKSASFNGTVLELMYKGEVVYINYSKSSGYVNGYRWLYVKRAKTGTIGYVYEKYVSDQS